MAHEADENERIPAAIIKTGWDIGLVQTAIPEELGGLGEMSAVTGVLAAEAFAYGDLAAAIQIMTPALFAYSDHPLWHRRAARPVFAAVPRQRRAARQRRPA